MIITMSILFGAELGPKADPTTTTYTPRPEWYFFFLFELLRVVKPPELVFLATIGIPTICLVLLLLLPFIDRNPERNPLRRPIAVDGRHRDDRRDGLPHDPRRARRLPHRDRPGGPARATRRARRSRPRRAASAATRSARTATRSGRTSPRSAIAARQGRDRAHAREPDVADAVLQPAARRSTPSSSTSSSSTSPRSRASDPALMSGGAPESGTLPDTQVRAMFDRIARVYDRMNSVMTAGMHHRWRERAVDLAQVGPGSRALDVATGTGDLAIELARRGAEVDGARLLPGDARDRAREGARPDASRRATRSHLDYPDACVRRGHRRLRCAQLRRPRPRPGRDGARDAAGRPRGGARDHHAAEAAAVVVLPGLVRPRRADAGPASRAIRTRTPTSRAACGASRVRRSWRPGWPRRVWRTCAGS